MSAKEMFLAKDCQWTETSWGIWIDTNASCEPGQRRLCMIDKREKKIRWQCENENIELDFEMIKALCKLIEELVWNDENNVS